MKSINDLDASIWGIKFDQFNVFSRFRKKRQRLEFEAILTLSVVRTIISGFATVIIMLLYGCTNVTLTDHLPEQGFSKPEIKKLCGIWTQEEVILNVAQMDSGEVYMGISGWEKNVFKAQKYRLYLTKTDNRQYVSVKDDKKGKYLFAEFNMAPGFLLVWGPDAKKIEQLINDKVLHGTIVKEKGCSRIDLSDKPNYVLKILSKEKDLFNYREPALILKKLK